MAQTMAEVLLERLKQLILDASLTPSFEAFQRPLDT